MKPLVIVGIIIAVLGGVALFRGVSYHSQHDLVRVGDMHASVSERHEVPVWAAGAALVVGLVLVGAGSRRRV
jgi:hypothetical protein